MNKINVFWFRRDLRLHDNTALFKAMNAGLKILPIFIFDDNILDELPKKDARVEFIYKTLKNIDNQLKKLDSSLLVLKGKAVEVWNNVIKKYNIQKVFFNRDYEPYSLERDKQVKKLLSNNNIQYEDFKDHIIFEPEEILKNDGKPYTVFTPFSKIWLKKYELISSKPIACILKKENFVQHSSVFPDLSEIGFEKTQIAVKEPNFEIIANYDKLWNFPAEDATSYLSPHLRFGTVGIREIFEKAKANQLFMSELIWREFFIHILYFFPNVVSESFKKKYDRIIWRNEQKDFELWCQGKTGYPIVDAGMNQLNLTGYMHNRVRMISASFLIKHLLVDWRWGEAYFAEKLLDYELASNNGNWQWVASTGCDAAPYFRIFNPIAQQQKFDKDFEYVKRWIPDFKPDKYISPIIEHSFARQRAIDTYKKALY